MTQPYDPNVLTTVDCPDMIRLGSRYDGGYVLPSRLLKRSRYLVSAGISFNWSFETRLTRASKLSDMVLIDATTTIPAYVQRARKHIGNSTTPRRSIRRSAEAVVFLAKFIIRLWIWGHRFQPAFLGVRPEGTSATNSRKKGSLAAFRHHVPDGSRETMILTLDEVLSMLEPKPEHHTVLLKMDIEDGEWDLLDSILAHMDMFSGIIIEVHSLGVKGKALMDFIQACEQRGMLLVHCHPNNGNGYCEGTRLPRLLELTMMSAVHLDANELEAPRRPPFQKRIGLDFPNLPHRADLEPRW